MLWIIQHPPPPNIEKSDEILKKKVVRRVVQK